MSAGERGCDGLCFGVIGEELVVQGSHCIDIGLGWIDFVEDEHVPDDDRVEAATEGDGVDGEVWVEE